MFGKKALIIKEDVSCIAKYLTCIRSILAKHQIVAKNNSNNLLELAENPPIYDQGKRQISMQHDLNFPIENCLGKTCL